MQTTLNRKFTKISQGGPAYNQVVAIVQDEVIRSLGDNAAQFNAALLEKLVQGIAQTCAGYDPSIHEAQIRTRAHTLTAAFEAEHLGNEDNGFDVPTSIDPSEEEAYQSILAIVRDEIMRFFQNDMSIYSNEDLGDLANEITVECLLAGYSAREHERQIRTTTRMLSAGFDAVHGLSEDEMRSARVTLEEEPGSYDRVSKIVASEIASIFGDELSEYDNEDIINLTDQITKECLSRKLSAANEQEVVAIKQIAHRTADYWKIHKDIDSFGGTVMYEEGPTDLDRDIAARIEKDTNGRIILTPLGAVYVEAPQAAPEAIVSPGQTSGGGRDHVVPGTAPAAPTTPGMGAVVGLPISDGVIPGQNDVSVPAGATTPQKTSERLFEAKIMMPEIYAWKIYAGAVSKSYLDNMSAKAEGDSPDAPNARQQLEILRNYFRQMPDDAWDRTYSAAKFEPKNNRIATTDGNLDTSAPELSKIPGHDTMRSWWASHLKTLPGWMYSVGVPAAGCRMVDEAMQDYRQQRNVWETAKGSSYAGPYTNPIAIALDKAIQGMPSDNRKQQVKDAIMSEHGVMRFNQKYPHNIEKEMLERRLLTKEIFIETRVAMIVSTQEEVVGDLNCNVSYITHIIFEIPDKESIKGGMREAWQELADSQSELIFPENTITQDETTGSQNTWVVTPMSVDIGGMVVETINRVISAAQNTNVPVLISPAQSLKKGERIPSEIEKTDTWGIAFETAVSQYDGMLSTNSAYSAELMWICEIAKDIAGLSRRMDEITMRAVRDTRKEAGKGSENLWHLRSAAMAGGGFRLSPVHETYENMINRAVRRGRGK